MADAIHPRICLHTPLGDVVVELDATRAPVTAAHFRALVEGGLLNDACFYRVVHRSNTPGEVPTIDVVQGGLGFERAASLPAVKLESTRETGLRHVRGTVSLARGAMDATGEFFICLGDHPILDAGGVEGPGADGFAAFGQVVAGLEVVEAVHRRPADADPPPGAEFLRGQFLSEPVPLFPRLAGADHPAPAAGFATASVTNPPERG